MMLFSLNKLLSELYRSSTQLKIFRLKHRIGLRLHNRSISEQINRFSKQISRFIKQISIILEQINNQPFQGLRSMPDMSPNCVWLRMR